MHWDWNNPDVFGVCLLSATASLLGLVGLLARRPGPWHRRGLGATALALGCLAAAGRAGGQAPAAWLAPALLAGTCALPLALTNSPLRRGFEGLLALLRWPRLPWLALLAAGPAAALGWLWHLEREAATEREAPGPFAYEAMPGTWREEERTAWTDRGAPVPVFGAGPHATLSGDRAADVRMVQSHGLDLRLIRTGPPDRGSNCHGWVFTGGRFVVHGDDVERILGDNGYLGVPAPRAGDLVIYRDRYGGIRHSGVVRVAADDGLILLESKWSNLGRYLHAPADYADGTPWAYYRSPRTGHLLRGLDAGTSDPGEMTPSGEPHANGG